MLAVSARADPQRVAGRPRVSGNFATQFVLRTDKGVTHLRGHVYQTGHFAVVPTFHPAACLYHEQWQPLLQQDIAMVGAWLREHPAAQVGTDAGSKE